MIKPYKTKPLGLPAKVGAPLLGVSLPSIYRRIRDGSLVTLDLDGHLLLSVPKLEQAMGRPLSLDEINGAVIAVADVEAEAGAQ